MRNIKEKKERALGVKLFLKAERCNSPKCVMVRRPYRPGVHGQKRVSLTEYGRQLHEKQKVQIYFGLTNQQTKNLFKLPKHKILTFLQHRLDQVVAALGFCRSVRVARQLVSHGHILVNNRKVTIPSYHVKIGDVVKINPRSRSLKVFENLSLYFKQYSPPSWLSLDKDKWEGKCVAEASTDSKQFPFDIDLVGQFYSK